jgi:transcriptional regulator with XRE-family HTH domain
MVLLVALVVESRKRWTEGVDRVVSVRIPPVVESRPMKQDDRARIATTLRRARNSAGLSLRKLAKRAETSHATVLAYEQGTKTPNAATFLRLLEACGYGVDIHLTRRIRARNGLDRGEELEQVLRLAEQFPVRVPRKMTYPPFR